MFVILYIFLRHRKRDPFQIDSVFEKFKPIRTFQRFQTKNRAIGRKKIYKLIFGGINVELFVYYITVFYLLFFYYYYYYCKIRHIRSLKLS